MQEKQYLEALRDLWSSAWPKGLARHPVYPFGEIPLTEYLRRWAAEQPDKPAIEFYGTTITYAELDSLSDRFAALLIAHGVAQGEAVCVFLQNCPQYLVVFYGILKAGAVHAPVSPLSKALELGHQIRDSGARTIVAQDQLMPIVREVMAEQCIATVLTTAMADCLPANPTIPIPASVAQPKVACSDTIDLWAALPNTTPIPLPPGDLAAVAALNYTSGTTGLPKGCIHTQGDMVYTAATGGMIGFDLQRGDVMLNFVPVFWIAGEDLGLIFPIFAGATLVLLARWDALAFLTAIDHYRVSKAYALVDNVVEAMQHPEAAKFNLRSLATLRVSSFVKKLGVGYRRQWEALAGGTMVEAAFGMTETHTFDTFAAGLQQDDFDLASRPIFVGLPVPGTEFKVCAFGAGELLPLGEEGEICIRSPSLLKGYWRNPDASAAALRDGWLHSGDNGVIDDQGFLHYLGRNKEMLKVNGMSVFPAEIEALLGQHPDITGSAVVGIPDQQRGEQPVAFIQLRTPDAATADDLTAWCRGNMSGFKVPLIRLVETLPLTATGKVKKHDLLKLVKDQGFALEPPKDSRPLET